MGTRIFVGNLAYGSNEESITQHFAQFGIALRSARVILDRDTGRSRGFAFAELADETQMAKAVAELDGSMLEGRPLAVREAHDKPGPGGGGGFGGGPRPSYGGPRPDRAPQIESRRPSFDSARPSAPAFDGPPRPPMPSAPPRDFGGPRESAPPRELGAPPRAASFGPPRPPGGAGPARKKPGKGRDREEEGARGRFDGEKRRRGFHGGRGYTEFEDDDD